MMPAESNSVSRRSASIRSATLGALVICLFMPACSKAFPVDIVPGEVKQKEPLPADADETKTVDEAAPTAKAVAAEEADPADKAADEKGKPVPVKPRKGIVRQKAVAAAAGAAEAAEEVGQVIGNILGGLFGGRARGAQAQNAAANAQALKQFEAQYGRHFDQTVRTELHFIRIVCQPTRQQYEAMDADGKLIRTKVLNKFALIHLGRQRGQSSSDNSDVRKPVAAELLISAERHLSPKQVAAYARELAARQEARKDTAVLITAAKLDRKLILTADQRDKTVTMLDDNWNESWGSMYMLVYGDRYFPDVPDPKLIPILTKTQQSVWRTVNQQNRSYWGFNVGMAAAVAIADEEWEDEPGEKPADNDLIPGKNLDVKKDSTAEEPAVPGDKQAVKADSEKPAAEDSK